MKELVTDTHSFLWHLYSPSRLGSAARQAFATTDTGETRIYIPSLVVAEALMVVQKHRLPGVELDELVEYLEIALHSSNYVLSDLQARMVLDGCGFHTDQAARTALLSGRKVSSIAGPHRSLRASARNWTMC